MNQEYTFYLRKKLETRIDRLYRADYQMFDHVLKQFWIFLNQIPILKSLFISLNLSDDNNKYKDKINDFYNNLDSYYLATLKIFNFYEISEHNEDKYILLCYLIICKCCESNSIGKDKPATIGMLINSRCNDNDEGLNKFKEEIIHPLYQYIDEQLDEQKLTIELIRRYKQKSEWFNRQKLYSIYKDNSSKGEKLLDLLGNKRE